ncbi:c-type cytochrome biogenesis protein CcmI [Paracoccus sp. 11-3]|uniref:C-type cytochrome biogenesis protein CcmI n=1 Tax=Paracoccus amoyensis TaxID=2760093 RepID=A0A926G7P1_9RHOB|nr:c-type cytochrome biogenesis protein CcmI [Paracoccus amoyensis]MBC9247363.1 c-type cytochrome biogenesis protein CcmI [Paracoccus amoyensis]
MFWIICTALVAIVAMAILTPILRARDDAQAQPVAAYDLQVYRDQLREVDRDLERGVIEAEDAQRLKAEIGRKVLDADRRLNDSSDKNGGAAVALPVIVMALVLVGAAALYWQEGAPGAPDMPMTARIVAAERAYDNRPTQAEAEANAPAAAPVELSEDDRRLIQQLRETVAQRPDDPQGLTFLVTYETRSGNIAAAREAQQRLIDLRGHEATADDHMRLGALMIEAAAGIVTPEAERVLGQALQIDPDQPQARYLIGLMYLQNGRADRTFAIWRRLLEQGPESAPWIAPIRAAMPDLAWLAGQPDYVAPAPVLTGPSAEDIASAEGMTDDERQDFIRGMVAQLEGRLAEQGGSPEEWARLISSLVVIGDTDHAKDIWTEAQSIFAASPQALATVHEAAQKAGLVE